MGGGSFGLQPARRGMAASRRPGRQHFRRAEAGCDGGPVRIVRREFVGEAPQWVAMPGIIRRIVTAVGEVFGTGMRPTVAEVDLPMSGERSSRPIRLRFPL